MYVRSSDDATGLVNTGWSHRGTQTPGLQNKVDLRSLSRICFLAREQAVDSSPLHRSLDIPGAMASTQTYGGPSRWPLWCHQRLCIFSLFLAIQGVMGAALMPEGWHPFQGRGLTDTLSCLRRCEGSVPMETVPPCPLSLPQASPPRNLRREQWSRKAEPGGREGHRCPSPGPVDRTGKQREAHHRCRTEQRFLFLHFLFFLTWQATWPQGNNGGNTT